VSDIDAPIANGFEEDEEVFAGVEHAPNNSVTAKHAGTTRRGRPTVLTMFASSPVQSVDLDWDLAGGPALPAVSGTSLPKREHCIQDSTHVPSPRQRQHRPTLLRDPVGAKEPVPEAPMADLVLHIHRELIHQLSEICPPRDLHPHAKPATNGATR
jgi:hypothetical protein